MKREIKSGKVDTRSHLVHECPQCFKVTKLSVLAEFSNEAKTKTSFRVHCLECHVDGYFLTEYMEPVLTPRKKKS